MKNVWFRDLTPSPSRRQMLGAMLGLAVPAAAGSPRIAAASDLRAALDLIAAQVHHQHGLVLTIVYGSSGVLARQIIDGAPFDLFLSADESYVQQVVQAGRAQGHGALYAVGRLVLFAPHDSPLSVDPAFTGLRALVHAGRPFRFAIANPAHAPYGRAAEAALRTHNLWTPIQPSLVLGENVSQAAQFAASGNAVGGLIAWSLVTGTPLARQGHAALVPADAHPPLRQRMVLLARASAEAARFYQYMLEPAARSVLDRHGFSLAATP